MRPRGVPMRSKFHADETIMKWEPVCASLSNSFFWGGKLIYSRLRNFSRFHKIEHGITS